MTEDGRVKIKKSCSLLFAVVSGTFAQFSTSTSSLRTWKSLDVCWFTFRFSSTLLTWLWLSLKNCISLDEALFLLFFLFLLLSATHLKVEKLVHRSQYSVIFFFLYSNESISARLRSVQQQMKILRKLFSCDFLSTLKLCRWLFLIKRETFLISARNVDGLDIQICKLKSWNQRQIMLKSFEKGNHIKKFASRKF